MIEEIGGDFLQWLRGFYFVAKRQSVTRASLEMRRNQPTISHQIRCLEKEFGVTLFDRSRGKMELTPEGEAFLEKAISVFEIIREMRSQTSKSYLEAQGKVVIAASHAIIHHFLPQFIVRFRKKFPMVAFELEGGGVEMILQGVESAEADFGIASLNTVPDGIVYHDLFETRLKLLAPKNPAFFSTQKPTLKQIAEAPFLFFPHYSTITSLIMKVFSERNLMLNVVMVLNNFESVKKYVALGMGVSILDDYTLTKEDKHKMEIYPLDRYLGRRRYGLILRKQKYLSPPARAFIRSIKPAIQIK